MTRAHVRLLGPCFKTGRVDGRQTCHQPKKLARPAPRQSRMSGRETRLPSLSQSNSPGREGGLEASGGSSVWRRLAGEGWQGRERPHRQPSPTYDRYQTGCGSLSAESARGGARLGTAVGSVRFPNSGRPGPRAALNSADRLCGSTRLPLGGFTYS
jgi:hypothetical protein